MIFILHFSIKLIFNILVIKFNISDPNLSRKSSEMNILDLLTDARDPVPPAGLGLLDLNSDCRAYILSFLDNKNFGVTQCTAKGFRVASVPEMLLRKIKDYSRCSCSQLEGPYYHATHNGWIDFAHYLKKSEVPISGGYDCIAGAYHYKQFPMLEWLIDNGYQPSYCSFHNAVRAGDIAFYERLSRLYPNTPSVNDYIIHEGLKSGSIPMVEHLLGKRLTIPISGLSIVYACESGSMEMVEFLETYWGMTCRQALQKWRDQEKEKIINSDLPSKKKNKALRNWPADILDYSIPGGAIRGGSVLILQKLLQQGFPLNDPRCLTSHFEEALNHGQIEILDWLKDQGLCPKEISYPNDLEYNELWRLTRNKGQLCLHWLSDNGISIRVRDVAVSALDALAIIDRQTT